MKTTLRLSIAAFVLTAFNLNAATLHVSLQSTNPVAPYATWETAANVIQDAVDAAKDGDTVLVTNGVYVTGNRYSGWGSSPARVVITNSIRLEGVSGPGATVIEGNSDEAECVRCVVLEKEAVLSGFTITNGHGAVGGGVFCARPLALVTNCIITGNFAARGGGLFGGTAVNCRFSGNTSQGVSNSGPMYADGGSAAAESTLLNCTITGNTDLAGRGVTKGCWFYNCTVCGNSEGPRYGIGGSHLEIWNSMVWGNTNGNWFADDSATSFNYCLTSPLPTNGVGNIDADPRFVNAAAGDYRLRPDSPCIDAGTNLLSLIQTDITGELRPWDGNKDDVTAFDIGAYEFRPSPVTLYVSVASTNPVAPFTTWATAAKAIQDAVDVAKDGDTVLVGDGVYSLGGGEYWLSATRTETARVVVTNAMRLESKNGPSLTTVVGRQPWTNDVGEVVYDVLRCVYLGDRAVLSGFTLTGGYSGVGGGVLAESTATVTNCTITRNKSAPLIHTRGGGVCGGSVYDSTISDNESRYAGGGAADSVLYNCRVSGNRSDTHGAGVADCTAYNCLITGNTGISSAYGTFFSCTIVSNVGYVWGTGFNSIVYGIGDGISGDMIFFNYCLTTPLQTEGAGNIDADPRFVDAANGDFRLRADSPCIDAGTNLFGVISFDQNGDVPYAHDGTDMLGNTRFIDGNGDGRVAWDIGAYEFNSYPPPRFSSPPRLTSDGWKLNLTGAHNKWVHVQRSSNLKDWEEIWYDWMGSTGEKQVIDGDTGQKAMFYRAFVE